MAVPFLLLSVLFFNEVEQLSVTQKHFTNTLPYTFYSLPILS